METRYQSKTIIPGDMWFENASKLKYRPQHYKYQLSSRQNEDSNKSIKCILIFIRKTVIASNLHTHTHTHTQIYIYIYTHTHTHKSIYTKIIFTNSKHWLKIWSAIL